MQYVCVKDLESPGTGASYVRGVVVSGSSPDVANHAEHFVLRHTDEGDAAERGEKPAKAKK